MGRFTPGNGWLQRLVRLKWVHVAIATVAARAPGVEVAETLIGSRLSMETTVWPNTGGRKRGLARSDECHFRIRSPFQPNEKWAEINGN